MVVLSWVICSILVSSVGVASVACLNMSVSSHRPSVTSPSSPGGLAYLLGQFWFTGELPHILCPDKRGSASYPQRRALVSMHLAGHHLLPFIQIP